jgi:Cu(I)/Ag(I) efflux system membrane protein CusA/SilA
MKPLATPVLGGMVSSLLHVLIVTPVIFFWIQERRLGLQHEELGESARVRSGMRGVRIAVAAAALIAIASLIVWKASPFQPRHAAERTGRIVQTVRTGDLDIVLLSPTGTLRQGRNNFAIEFRRAGTDTLVNVGDVHASANMTMPGMVMSGGLKVTTNDVPGRYLVTGEFGMAGTWQMAIEWNGPAGQGSVKFEGGVQ